MVFVYDFKSLGYVFDTNDAVVTRNSGPIIFLKRFISHTNYRVQRDKQRTGQTNGSETRERNFFGKDPFKLLSEEEILKDKFTHQTNALLQ